MSGKILIVDDEPFMRNLLIKILEPTGSEFVEAGDGIDALAKYKEHKPDLVLLDINMPNFDGIESLRLILTLDRYAKVVMCSTAAQLAIAKEMIAIGARDFIVKPFDATKIIEVVSNNMPKVI